MTSIEIVMGIMIFLCVFVSICDFLMLSNRYSSMTDTAKEITRTLSVQGGALNIKPGAYSANYYNINELGKILKKQMNGMGFKDDEYRVSVRYTKIYDNVEKKSKEVDFEELIIGERDDGTYGVIDETKRIDYLSDFTVRVSANYNWPFINSIFKLPKATLDVKMPGLSEWRYNYDGWTEEG